VADAYKLIIYVRWSNPLCTDMGWIPGGHRPKPHACFLAKTISRGNLTWVYRWYMRITKRLEDKGITAADMLSDEAAHAYTWVQGALVAGSVSLIQGVVLINVSGKPEGPRHHGMPLRAATKRGGLTDKDPKFNYKNKWITGDYDLYDIMSIAPDCERPDETKAAFKQVKRELNTKMKWGGIQHGPQVQWSPHKGKEDENFPARVTQTLGLAASGVNPKTVPPVVVDGRPIPVMAGEVLAVFPGGTVSLASGQDVAEALLCKGCTAPAPMKEDEYKK